MRDTNRGPYRILDEAYEKFQRVREDYIEKRATEKEIKEAAKEYVSTIQLYSGSQESPVTVPDILAELIGQKTI